MRVFITGGSGYIGSALVPALIAAGHEVTALARNEDGAGKLAGVGAVPIVGELSDVDVLRAAARAADGVIHLAPSSPDVDLAASQAMQFELGDGPFVFTGGAWVYGDTHGIADETAPLAPPPIVAWRVQNTDVIMRSAEHGGRPVLVMPAAVYGDGGGLIHATMIAPAKAEGYASYIGDGGNHIALVHVHDIARLYVLALTASPGSRFVGVGDSSITMRELAKPASAAAGAGGVTRSITLGEAQRIFGPLADALALDQQFTSQHARDELGWSPTGPSPLEYLRGLRDGPMVDGSVAA
jgi:nucleoside-diphosphate-sugar epimerase